MIFCYKKTKYYCYFSDCYFYCINLIIMKKYYLPLIAILMLGCNQNTKHKNNNRVIFNDFSSFSKPAKNPILEPDSTFNFQSSITGENVSWQKADVFNPAAIVKDDKVYLLFRAEDNPSAILGHRTSRIGLAISEDGINFKKHPTPVLYPDKDEFMKYDYPGGCEDPRIIQTEDGLYVMVYTSWNYEVARLSIAFSRDLINWDKKGPAFIKANEGKFLDIWSKSGSIITKMVDTRQVAAKIDGKYWMYWGEKFINLAWSENLIDWYPQTDEKGNLKSIVETRDYMFDSDLTECGPPALITDEGIVLLYNGKNSMSENADTTLPKGTYSVGKIVFDKDNPTKVISRSDSYLLKPSLPHETSGQYKSGTTFAEGLVYYKSKWFLYYGTADSYVGVATADK